jgi:ADP-ribose pyrophosphatase YjhB (NUDIX family)
MRQRAVGIIVQNNKILLIHRIKDNEEYYCLPGGGVEDNEISEDAVIREIQEELNVIIESTKKVFEFENKEEIETYYLINRFSGLMKIIGDMKPGRNMKDSVEWCDKKKIEQVNLVPLKAKQLILKMQIVY